jgi:hypothetical protein
MTSTDTAHHDALLMARNLERRDRIVAALDAEGLLDRITGRQLDHLLTCSAEDLAVPSARRMAERVTIIRELA